MAIVPFAPIHARSGGMMRDETGTVSCHALIEPEKRPQSQTKAAASTGNLLLRNLEILAEVDPAYVLILDNFFRRA